MIELSKVLVTSPSSVLRELLRVILRPHAADVSVAGSREEARDLLASDAFELLISDESLPDGGGLELLCDARALEGPRPDVILLSHRLDPLKERRAVELGALGCLTKPVGFREIARVLKKRSGAAVAQRGPRRRAGGHAWVLEPADRDAASTDSGVPQLVWNARDVSTTGAFLETEAPIAVGTVLHLALDLAGRTPRVRAEVVRVQEPGWGRAGGVGVSFVELADGAEEMLEAYVAARRSPEAR